MTSTMRWLWRWSRKTRIDLSEISRLSRCSDQKFDTGHCQNVQLASQEYLRFRTWKSALTRYCLHNRFRLGPCYANTRAWLDFPQTLTKPPAAAARPPRHPSADAYNDCGRPYHSAFAVKPPPPALLSGQPRWSRRRRPESKPHIRHTLKILGGINY